MNYTSISDANKLLKGMSYLKDFKTKKSKFSAEFINASKNGDYLQSYRAAIRNLDYDILLVDDSFIQFEERNEDGTVVLRFAYFENPFDTITYDAYLSHHGLELAEAGELFRDDYDQEMSEVDEKDEYFPIRYDCSELTYEDGIHPYSHFHIGFDESLSIPIDKILSPLCFVLFVLKTRYYHLWKKEMQKRSEFYNKYIAEKATLQKVSAAFCSTNDKLELHLT